MDSEKVMEEVKKENPVTCGFCQHRFPQGQPIPLMVPLQPEKIIVKEQQRAQFMPVCCCRNSESSRYNQILYIEATCEKHKPIVEDKKKDDDEVTSENELIENP